MDDEQEFIDLSALPMRAQPKYWQNYRTIRGDPQDRADRKDGEQNAATDNRPVHGRLRFAQFRGPAVGCLAGQRPTSNCAKTYSDGGVRRGAGPRKIMGWDSRVSGDLGNQ